MTAKSPAIAALVIAFCATAMPGGAQTQAAPAVRHSPDVLPGKGLLGHDFLYAGEWDTRKPMQTMFIVRGGKIVWQYSMPLHPQPDVIQEFDDATLLDNGNIIFSHMSGATEVRPDKTIAWHYDAPKGTEVHSVQAVGKGRVLIMRNGNPAEAMIINTKTGKILHEIPIPTTITKTHGQFRHIRMTAAGTILVPHMGENKVVEYDMNGKVVWSVEAKNPWQAVRLKNGNTLISGDAAKYVREVNPKGETVWEFTQADVPDITLFNTQTAQRLANGNTVISNWSAGSPDSTQWADTVQFLEVTPDKKVVWALRSWKDPADLGPSTSIQLLDQPGSAESLQAQR
jgi:hypothetical protein